MGTQTKKGQNWFSVRGKKILINISILIGVTIISLLLAEVGLRLLVSNENTPGYWPKENAVYVPGLKKNVYTNLNNFTRTTAEFSYSISTNEYGFRDFHDFEKPADTSRIVVLGTSSAFGNTVEAHENHLALLETELEVKQELTQDIETINLGLGGIGYDEMQYILTEYGLKYEPDLVLVEVELGTFYSSHLFSKKDSPSEGKTSLYMWVYQNSKLANHFYWKIKTTSLGFKIINFLKLNKHGQDSNNFDLNFLQKENFPEIKNSKLIAYKNLKEIKDILDQRNIPLVMAYIPPYYQTDKQKLQKIILEYNLLEESLDVQAAQDFYIAAAKRLNIPLFEPTEELIDFSKTEDLSWNYDGHLNKEGNKFYAALLADFIDENDLMET